MGLTWWSRRSLAAWYGEEGVGLPPARPQQRVAGGYSQTHINQTSPPAQPLHSTPHLLPLSPSLSTPVLSLSLSLFLSLSLPLFFFSLSLPPPSFSLSLSLFLSLSLPLSLSISL